MLQTLIAEKAYDPLEHFWITGVGQTSSQLALYKLEKCNACKILFIEWFPYEKKH